MKYENSKLNEELFFSSNETFASYIQQDTWTKGAIIAKQ